MKENESASCGKMPPTEHLREMFSYEPETGELKWMARPLHHFGSKRAQTKFNRERAGKAAGSPDGGRLQVSFWYLGKKRKFGVHQIIFQWMGVAIPDGMEVDHEDRVATNNRWSNLRLATHSQNCCNRKHSRWADGTKKLPKWVQYFGGKYFFGQVFHKGVKYPMGRFNTPKEAHAACLAKARELHGEFVCS